MDDGKSQHEQFIRLFLEVQPRIYGYLRTMIFNRADAEDVLQDVAKVPASTMKSHVGSSAIVVPMVVVLLSVACIAIPRYSASGAPLETTSQV